MPSSYVIDTHTCVFALEKPARLGKRARRALRDVEAGKATAWVPAAVAAEIVLLHELGRTDVGLPQLEAAMDDAPGLRFLPIDLLQLREFAAHASIRDPFDRLIVSAARVTSSQLISRDEHLSTTGLVHVVWS